MSHKKISQKDKETLEFLKKKKKQMKDTKYRKTFDSLYEEIQQNLINTGVQYGEKIQEASGWSSTLTYTMNQNGKTDLNVYPTRTLGMNQNRSNVPNSQEPIAFSKIITAASVLGAKVPDATTFSDSKIYAKTAYELWKAGWRETLGNGKPTLISVFQNLLTYGWASWRVFPREVSVQRNKVPKILFSGIYREALNPARTWLGVGSNNYDIFSRFEVYYEKDLDIDTFMEMYPEAKDKKGKLDYCCSLTDEGKNEDNEKIKTHVTISFYENVLLNRLIISCGEMIIYDDQLPNDDSYGSVVTVGCFDNDPNNPYKVGVYEMIRGNTAMYSYINSLNAQQVEAEIFPLLFGTQIQNGNATYKRGPNIINPKSAGSSIDVVKTGGNIQAGVMYADRQKQNIEDNTGINNIIAGSSSENTLGSTLILKEAAQNRLLIPRNNVVDGLELDALISNSWVRQTMSVDKIFKLTGDEEVAEFVAQNPDMTTETFPVTDDDGNFLYFIVAASQNVRLNFDFDEEGGLIEDIPERKISGRKLFEELGNYNHLTHSINFTIDPNSMLLPSQAIEQQQYAELYPIINQTLTQIFAARMQDPQFSAALMRSFETFLKKYKYDIFDYISKNTYQEIMNQSVSQSQIAMTQLNQQLNPEGEPNEMGQGMTNDGAGAMTPQAPQEMSNYQSPMGASVDASLGYAASMPMTPNK